MDVAETNARARAYDLADWEVRQAMHRFVVTYFGGDHRRAAWFLDELANGDKE